MLFLIKLEKNLKAQMDAWESQQGREFFVNGQKFLEYVEEQWEQHRVEKEKEKQERVSKLTSCIIDMLRHVLTPLFINLDSN